MRELRAVALSEDGGYLVLAEAGGRAEAEQFRVPVDDRLRAALRGARRSEVRTESALTPREIQARLRAGETAADVARAAGIPVERVERYEGPVLAERARVVQEARAALLPKDPGGAPGRPLGEVVDARLMAGQDNPEAAQWDAWRRVDGIWLVQLTSESRCARWTWDPVVRRVRPHDDAARALVAPEPLDVAPAASAPPSAQGAAALPPARQGSPALTLVQDPSQPSAGARPLAAQPTVFPPEQRPRYPQPASFPDPGYLDSPGAVGPPPGTGQPMAPFPTAPAHQEPRYPAPHSPAARYPAEPVPGAARQRGDDRERALGDQVLGRPAERYQDPAAYQAAGPRPEHYAPAEYPAEHYPPEMPVPAPYPTSPPPGGEVPRSRPVAPFSGERFADDRLGDPSFVEHRDEPFMAGHVEPAGSITQPPAAAYRFQDLAPGRGDQAPALGPNPEVDVFGPPVIRPPRPAAAHRPAIPPALDPRPTRPLEARRFQEHDDLDLDADLFDEPADRLDAPSPAAGRPLPRPATAPPRAAVAPPRALPPRPMAAPRQQEESGSTSRGRLRPAMNAPTPAGPAGPRPAVARPAGATPHPAPNASPVARPEVARVDEWGGAAETVLPGRLSPAGGAAVPDVPAAARAGQAAVGGEQAAVGGEHAVEPVPSMPPSVPPSVPPSAPPLAPPPDPAAAPRSRPGSPAGRPPLAAPRPATATDAPVGVAAAQAEPDAVPANVAAMRTEPDVAPAEVDAEAFVPPAQARPAVRTRYTPQTAAQALGTATEPVAAPAAAATGRRVGSGAAAAVEGVDRDPLASTTAAAVVDAAVTTEAATEARGAVTGAHDGAAAGPATPAPPVTQVDRPAAEPAAEAAEEPPAKPDVTKKTPATAGSRATPGGGAGKSGEKSDKAEKPAGKNQDRTPGSAVTDSEEPATGQPSNRPRNTPRTGERSGGGRRGRKSVPAWDDIVFGARRT